MAMTMERKPIMIDLMDRVDVEVRSATEIEPARRPRQGVVSRETSSVSPTPYRPAQRVTSSPTPLDSTPPPAPPLEPGIEAPAPPPLALNDPAAVATMNRQAAVLENALFPRQLISALGLGEGASLLAVRLFLIRFREEAGSPQDAIEKLLLDQLILAHLKVVELHALGAEATSLDFKALYSNSAARLLGVICQLVATLTTYRAATRPRSNRRAKTGRAAKRGGGKTVARNRDGTVGEEKTDTEQASKAKKGRR
jgi:hypothetical protein